jgi:hypothetical protein
VNDRSGQVSASLLLLIFGVWLLLQTVVGNLPGRLLSWRGYNPPSVGAATPSSQGESGFAPRTVDPATGVTHGGIAGGGPSGGGGVW